MIKSMSSSSEPEFDEVKRKTLQWPGMLKGVSVRFSTNGGLMRITTECHGDPLSIQETRVIQAEGNDYDELILGDLITPDAEKVAR